MAVVGGDRSDSAAGVVFWATVVAVIAQGGLCVPDDVIFARFSASHHKEQNYSN